VNTIDLFQKRNKIYVIERQKCIELHLLSEEGKKIIETDEEQIEIDNLKTSNINLYDLRKYGRVKLLYLNRKE